MPDYISSTPGYPYPMGPNEGVVVAGTFGLPYITATASSSANTSITAATINDINFNKVGANAVVFVRGKNAEAIALGANVAVSSLDKSTLILSGIATTNNNASGVAAVFNYMAVNQKF